MDEKKIEVVVKWTVIGFGFLMGLAVGSVLTDTISKRRTSTRLVWRG